MGDRVERKRRIALFVPVHFEWDGHRETGLSTDISRTGIYVRTDAAISVGQTLSLSLAARPGNGLIEITARAVHVLEGDAAIALARFPGVGFEFADSRAGQLSAVAELVEEAIRKRSASMLSLSGRRILVADSEPRVLSRMTTILDNAGCIVETASNGVEAYSICLERQPDLVVCDEKLPIMDGKALEARLASDGLQVAVTFARKPFADIELCSRVSCALNKQDSVGDTASLEVGLDEMSLGSLLSFVEAGRKTGIIVASRGTLRAELRVREGRIVSVRPAGDRTGRERLMQLLDWTSGVFKFHTCSVEDEDQVECSIARLLMEHARVQDEIMDKSTAVRDRSFRRTERSGRLKS
jgi:CheY-like chemotaxis protein